MSQNLLSLSFDAAQLTAIDQALDQLETACAGLIALEPEERRTIYKMGDKSEAFCRQALTLLAQNPQVVPPSLGLTEAQADLVAVDELRPRLARVQRLHNRMVDSETAMGSDIISTALQGYALLKVAGKNQGLETLKDALGSRFKSRRRQPDPVAE